MKPSRIFNKYLAINPDLWDGYLYLGFAKFEIGQYDAALKALEKSIELYPMESGALIGKAIVLMRTGKTANAKESLKAAITLDPAVENVSGMLNKRGYRFGPNARKAIEELYRLK